MQWLRDLKFRSKLMLLMSISLCGFMSYLLFNEHVANNNALQLLKIKEVYFPVIEQVKANINRLDSIKTSFELTVMIADIEELQGAELQRGIIIQNFAEQVRIDPSSKQTVEKLQNLLDAYFYPTKSLAEKMVSESIDFDQAKRLAIKNKEAFRNIKSELKLMYRQTYVQFNNALESANDASQQAVVVGWVLGAVIFTSMLLTTMWLISLIGGNLNNVIQSLKAMATGTGDLTQRLQSNCHDEIGELVHWFNTFVMQLQMILIEIVADTTILENAVQQLQSATNQTHEQVHNQQSETTQVATAMQEMVASLDEVVRSAEQTAQEAHNADQDAQLGQQVVGETISDFNILAEKTDQLAELIKRLEHNSKDVSTILGVIQNIAEQTNLLALNAAIESARAGEHGRGFSVVADEVRTLANSTQKSTQDIQLLIDRLLKGTQDAATVIAEGVEHAHTGVEKADQAGKTLALVTQAISRINEMNREIAHATEQQSAVTTTINQSLNNITLLADESSESVQETKDCSGELENVAQRLQSVVSKFKV